MYTRLWKEEKSVVRGAIDRKRGGKRRREEEEEEEEDLSTRRANELMQYMKETATIMASRTKGFKGFEIPVGLGCGEAGTRVSMERDDDDDDDQRRDHLDDDDDEEEHDSCE